MTGLLIDTVGAGPPLAAQDALLATAALAATLSPTLRNQPPQMHQPTRRAA